MDSILFFSFIIPVYNRPDEIDELLNSMINLDYNNDYEIVIIEDGSNDSCEHIINQFPKLNISYYFKENSGPGDSRNYGMSNAKGNYFLILDSDVILPSNYLKEVENNLNKNYVDCFGGIDTAHESFTDMQKAIDYSMTSFFTTGGIRGGNEVISKFQPRSFNMGISKNAFLESKGFGKIHPGEDPDLSIRLWDLGYKTSLFKSVSVFHKRRISWSKFKIQVSKFGKCRPILNYWHPQTSKLTYWFPTLFILGILLSILGLFLGNIVLILLYSIYFNLILIESFIKYKSLKISFLSLFAVLIQFYGYGLGYLISYLKINLFNQNPEKAFPNLFFK